MNPLQYYNHLMKMVVGREANEQEVYEFLTMGLVRRNNMLNRMEEYIR
jgi:hypothetical protein